jgi:ATP-binding cassette subfamily B protein
MRSDSSAPATGPETDPGTSDQGWLRRLFGYCWRYPRPLLLGFAGSVVAMVVAALSPLVVRQIVDEVILSRRSPLLPWLALLIGAGLVRAGCSFARRYWAGQLGYQVDHALRTDLFDDLQRLDGAQQDRLRTGQVVSRATSDVTMVERLIAMGPLVTSNLILLLASLVIMAVLSPLLTIVALLMVPALFVVVRHGAKVFFPSTWDRAQQAGEVAGVVEAAVTGVRVVKGFGQEQRELGRLERPRPRCSARRCG